MSGLYIEIWKKYLNDLLSMIKQHQGEIPVDSSLFKSVGNRKASGYSFRLDIENGFIPPKSNSAVARDLKKVLDESTEFQKIAKSKNIMIRLDSQFKLIVQVS